MYDYGDYTNKRFKILTKLLRFNWFLLFLILVLATISLLMLYAVRNGDPAMMIGQARYFALGIFVMFFIALTPPKMWKYFSPVIYFAALALLIGVLLFGETAKGAERWIALGPVRIQPSEFMKLGLILMMAWFYALLPAKRVSNPLFLVPPLAIIVIPTALIFIQPDLGTSLFMLIVGFGIIFAAGVSIWYFLAGIFGGIATIYFTLQSRGTNWQILKDYQYARIDTFLNPESDSSGSGYHIIQSKIALGSGGLEGRGYMQGSQSRLNFLPESHTDFIFTSYAESFGFVGTVFLLGVFLAISLSLLIMAKQNHDRFGRLLIVGVAVLFFTFYAINTSMVIGLMPVVGVPLPFISRGGSSILMLCAAMGMVQNVHVNRPKKTP